MHISERELARLHAAIEGVEAHEHWDEGTALRVNILKFYGWDGLRLIETYEPPCRRTPVVDTWPGDTWIKAGPWSAAREYRRRKDEIRALYRG